MNELDVMFNAIYRLKFSELLPYDQHIFLSISREIFRGVEPSHQSCQNLEEAIEGVCDKKFLSNHPYFSEKVQQLYQMIRYEKKLMDEAI